MPTGCLNSCCVFRLPGSSFVSVLLLRVGSKKSRCKMEKPSRLLVIIRRRQLISNIKNPYYRNLPETEFRLYKCCGWWNVGIDTVYSIRVCRIKRKVKLFTKFMVEKPRGE